MPNSVGLMKYQNKTTMRELNMIKPVFNKSRLALLISMSLMGQSVLAQSQGSSESKELDASDTETIQVTGVRSSLQKALFTKKEADSFVDAISAEDIGELPDSNLAEALQRISGVQIVRSDAGVRTGRRQAASVRALAAQATMDGRRLISGARTRDFDFSRLPSEIFDEIVVSKTSTADQIEGGVGGTIELYTRSPLDYDGFVGSFQAKAIMRDKADSTNPNFSGFIATQNDDKTFGVSVAFTYENVESRQDWMQNRGGYRIRDLENSGFDFDDNGTSDVLAPSQFRYIHRFPEIEKSLVDATVAFKPNDELEITLKGTYTEEQADYRLGVLVASGFIPNDAVNNSLVVDNNGTVRAGQFSGGRVQIDGRYEPVYETVANFGVNAKWQRDEWTVEFDASTSSAKRDYTQYINRFRNIDPISMGFDLTGNRVVPELNILQNGSPIDLTDRSLYRVDLAFNNDLQGDGDQEAVRFDVERELDGSILSSIKAGLRYQSYQITGASFNDRTGEGVPLVVDPDSGEFNPISDPAFDPMLSFPFPVNDLFYGAIANNTQWILARYPGATPSNGGAYWDIYSTSDTNRVEDPRARFDITEDTFAAYFRANFEGEIGDTPYEGNFGLRYVTTDATSKGLIQVRVPGEPDRAIPEEDGNDYDNILPSFNVTFELQDDLLLRAALGRSMRRATVDSLRLNTRAQPSTLDATAGNIKLKPLVSDNFDIGIEYYFDDASAFSLTAFYKDVKDFEARETEENVDLGIPSLDTGENELYTVTRPVNGDSAEVLGLEISYQQAFTNLPGLLGNTGAIVNYTYVDVDTESGVELPGISDSMNAILYYDDGQKFNARIAYNWRSDYASEGEGGNRVASIGINEFIDSDYRIDFSANYNFSENGTVFFEVLNLTEENVLRYSGVESRVRDYIFSERTFTVGARYTF